MNIKSRVKSKIRRILVRWVEDSSWYNEVSFADCRKFWKYAAFGPNCDFDLKVVNTGSTSGVYAFDYRGLPVKGDNWALHVNPLAADAAILENYSSFLDSAGATVLISLCPFSSLSGSRLPLEDRYYALLNPRSIPSFSRKRMYQIIAKKNNPLLHYPLIEALRDIRSRIRNVLCMRRSGGGRFLSEQEMEIDSQRWMDGWCHEFGIKRFSDPLSLVNCDGIHDAARILNRMIRFCRERSFRPVLVIPPMYHTLAEKFTPEMREMLIGSLVNLIEDKSVPLLNHMDDPDFSMVPKYFRNSYFLNECGARVFTDKVLSAAGVVS